MTSIKTTCHICGDVELTPENLMLELDPSEDSGQYRFLCPTCDTVQRRPANARVVSVLLSTGVEYMIVDHSPISEEEISEFAAALDADFDLSKLIAS